MDHGDPEMKCTYFNRNCWIKIAQNDRSHAMDISRITKPLYIEKLSKNRKNDPLKRKKMNFQKKIQEYSISYGTRFSQPKYHIPR